METTKTKIICGETLLILVLALSISSVCLATEGIWTQKADKPTARYLLASCAVDGKIYAIGGAPAPLRGSRNVEAYDPLTNTWEQKADMLALRAGLGASVVNGKIYAIGGSSAGSPSVEEYDPATDTWTPRADMPTRRSFLSTSVVDGKIYAVGGAVDTDGPFFSTVEEYNPATDTWSSKPDLPEPRYLHTAGVVNGKIYVIAGSPRNWTASSAVFEYDPTKDSWTRKTDAHTVRSWLSPNAGVVNGRIYVIGGDFGPPKANVEEYDPATDTWTTRAYMPNPRGALSTTALNGRIYVIGGSTTIYDALVTVEEYFPNPLIVDFNGDGIVGTKEILRLIESWDQDDPLCDIAPPFGDGVVDALDLELLMSYWGQPVDDPTLIAHWALDEAEGDVAYDSAGVNDASVIREPVWQPEGGMVDGALEFDGTDDYVSTPFILNPAEGLFSVFAWIKGGVPGQAVLSQMGGANWLCSDPLEGKLMAELKGSGRGAAILQSQTIITDGNWHRIGFVWDGTYRSLYVDDILVAEDTQQGLISSVGGLNIGCGSDASAGTFWSGLIDDVRIYNRAVRP
jgi:N-acetylneuraminic acid mutarotase